MIAGDIPDLQGLVFLLVVTIGFVLYASWIERRAKRRLRAKVEKFLNGCAENRRAKSVEDKSFKT